MPITFCPETSCNLQKITGYNNICQDYQSLDESSYNTYNVHDDKQEWFWPYKPSPIKNKQMKSDLTNREQLQYHDDDRITTANQPAEELLQWCSGEKESIGLMENHFK